MRRRGEITVFLALTLLCVWALMCGLVESARTAGARCYLRQAVDSSMDSLLSQYHRQLWGKYHILGLEFGDKQGLEQELCGFLSAYLEAINWYPLEAEEIQTAGMETLADRDGAFLEQQILDYMKYGLLNVEWEEIGADEAVSLARAVGEAGAVHQVADRYKAHAKEAVQLEKALEKLDKALSSQEEAWRKGTACLAEYDGDGFVDEVGRVEAELRKVPDLVKAYEARADRLDEKLKESRREFETEKEHMSEAVLSGIEAEIRQYETYTSQDGARRRQVAALSEQAVKNLDYTGQAAREAVQVQEYIDSWEPDEDEDEELDEAALWKPVREFWAVYPVLDLNVEFGIADPEKQSFLERVLELAAGDLLALLLPEGTEVSDRMPDLTFAPSGQYLSGGEAGSAQPDVLLKHLVIGEYALRFFDYYGREPDRENCCAYEVEYLLFGHAADRKNLEAAAARLLAVREGINLAYILSDAQKREEARTLALAITGGTGLLPLTGVVMFFVMGIWALGEAILDVRTLFGGGRVPFLKTRESWKLSLEGLLEAGKGGNFTGSGPEPVDEKNGMDYRGYMRLLLFLSPKTEVNYRMLDMIQANLRAKQPDFRIDHCAHAVEMKVRVCGKHLFLGVGVWKAQSQNRMGSYNMKMSVSGSY